VFAELDWHRGTVAALAHFLADTDPERRFEYLCRSACLAAKLDPNRWEVYSGAVYREIEAARWRAENEQRGA
jgi:hypothetical protein